MTMNGGNGAACLGDHSAGGGAHAARCGFAAQIDGSSRAARQARGAGHAVIVRMRLHRADQREAVALFRQLREQFRDPQSDCLG
jgi:hypothetical protein